MSNRTTRIRIGNALTLEGPLTCGLTQGLPTSPILFMLYTELILRLGGTNNKLSYADDVAILQYGKTTESTHLLA